MSGLVKNIFTAEDVDELLLLLAAFYAILFAIDCS